MTQTLWLDTYGSDTMVGHLCLKPFTWTPMSQTLWMDTYDSDPMAVTTYDSDPMAGHL